MKPDLSKLKELNFSKLKELNLEHLSNINLLKNKKRLFKVLIIGVIVIVGFVFLSKRITFVGGLPTFKKKEDVATRFR